MKGFVEDSSFHGHAVPWISYAKGLGILLVIFGNATPALQTVGCVLPRPVSFLETCVYSFHMPLFFFLAGMLVEQSLSMGLAAFVGKKLRTLLYPYLLWSLIFDGFYGRVHSFSDFWPGMLAVFYEPFMYEHLWFLYVLFWISLLYSVFRWLSATPREIFLVALVARLFARSYDLRLGLITRLFERFPYFALAAVFRPQLLKWLDEATARTLALFSFYGFLVLGVSVWSLPYRQPVFAFLVGMSGIFATLCAARYLDLKKWAVPIRKIGNISLIIYALQLPFINGTVFLLRRLEVASSGILLIGASAAGLAGPIAFFYMLRRLRALWLVSLEKNYADRYIG